jgi:hypothetical protein
MTIAVVVLITKVIGGNGVSFVVVAPNLCRASRAWKYYKDRVVQILGGFFPNFYCAWFCVIADFSLSIVA